MSTTFAHFLLIDDGNNTGRKDLLSAAATARTTIKPTLLYASYLSNYAQDL
jgi:hypothetical protein